MNNSAQNSAEELRRKQRHQLDKPISVTDSMTQTALGSLVNITLDGLMIVSSTPLDSDRIYQVEFDLPEPVGEHTSIELAIDCLWVKSGDKQDVNWAGCAIIDATPSAIKIIETLIREHSSVSI